MAAKVMEITDMPTENLDELSSLEQEIAKLHNIEPSSEESESTGRENCIDGRQSGGIHSGTIDTTKNGSNECSSTLDLKPHEPSSTAANEDLQFKQKENTKAALEDVDLIALLKGTDTANEEDKEPTIEVALAELDNVGVTIEGEGQYEIMEIEDDDNNEGSAIPAAVKTSKKTSSLRATPVKVQNVKSKLSPEQARAVALEQMADLKYEQARRKEAAVIRQQQQQQDVITTLNDDWNEYDSNYDSNQEEPVVSAKKLPIKTNSPKASSSNVMKNSLVVKVKKTPIPSKITDSIQSSSPPPVETSGFKRTRIVKPKIIWDPDVPETYSQYVTSKNTPPPPPPSSPSPSALVRKGAGTPVVVTLTNKKEVTARKPRAATPKESRPRPASVIGDNAIKLPVAKSTPLAATAAAATSPTKRRSKTPLPNGAGSVTKKKKISEIDRLMGDEGAANMIHAVEHEQRELSAGLETGETNKNKPLMRKRALTITGRQRVVESPSATTKKDHSMSSTPKSIKSIVAATPGETENSEITNTETSRKPRANESWDYVYKQRASEESMIMRRRSNSSYSSASHLSLENKTSAILSDDANDSPSFKFLKPENKTNQRSEDASPVAQTLSNDLKGNPSKSISKSELVVVHKVDKVAHLVVNMQRSKTNHTYNAQLLQKLTETLIKVGKSNEYNTVLLSTQSANFCQGIDCQGLIVGALEKRKNNAKHMALALKTYLKTLATFQKPVVAGVVGDVRNLGVMQLPLLDYVVAADNCTFETNYSKMGHLPEGYALWHNHQKVSSNVHARLILLSERLQTTDLAGSQSLIDKVCSARCVNDEALTVAKRISSTTAENYITLKRLNHATTILAALNRMENEFNIIAEQWATAICQANFKRFLNDVDF